MPYTISIKSILASLFIALTALTACQKEASNVDSVLPELDSDPQTRADGFRPDSLVEVKIPDFGAVVKNSVTPTGKLDRFTIRGTVRYSVDSPLSHFTRTTRFFYDSQSRITGHCLLLEGETNAVDKACIYEYKENKPYRQFAKAAEFGSQTLTYYVMYQFAYDEINRPIARLRYRVEPNGRGRLQAFEKILYPATDQQTFLDVALNSLGQRRTYRAGNLILDETIRPTGEPTGISYSYAYDTVLNPLKGLFWLPGDRAYDESTNNIISKKILPKTSPSGVLSELYKNEYDAKGRLIERHRIETEPNQYVEQFVYAP